MTSRLFPNVALVVLVNLVTEMEIIFQLRDLYRMINRSLQRLVGTLLLFSPKHTCLYPCHEHDYPFDPPV
jgi:hypothetical protein